MSEPKIKSFKIHNSELKEALRDYINKKYKLNLTNENIRSWGWVNNPEYTSYGVVTYV